MVSHKDNYQGLLLGLDNAALIRDHHSGPEAESSYDPAFAAIGVLQAAEEQAPHRTEYQFELESFFYAFVSSICGHALDLEQYLQSVEGKRGLLKELSSLDLADYSENGPRRARNRKLLRRAKKLANLFYEADTLGTKKASGSITYQTFMDLLR
ncbi:hypothetical protein DL93DRAFT_954443 [Clavulina sp. PMI_390]|nr:hypothetical protein DL93DRAFT_954443 [Clavulina sp. PMI_390]